MSKRLKKRRVIELTTVLRLQSCVRITWDILSKHCDRLQCDPATFACACVKLKI